MNNTFQLTVRGLFARGETTRTLTGNWEQVNHWKRLHTDWQISAERDGRPVVLAQSITFHEANVWDVMSGLAD